MCVNEWDLLSCVELSGSYYHVWDLAGLTDVYGTEWDYLTIVCGTDWDLLSCVGLSGTTVVCGTEWDLLSCVCD